MPASSSRGKAGIVAIPGTTRAERLAKNVAALDVELTEQDIGWLDQTLASWYINTVAGCRGTWGSAGHCA